MIISDDLFETLVVQALDELPSEVVRTLDNVDVVIAPEPTNEQRASVGVKWGTLLGLYEGIPQTERGSSYGFVVPDRITIFQGPIARAASGEADVKRIVRDTVRHELAHHFGISDERLRELGRY